MKKDWVTYPIVQKLIKVLDLTFVLGAQKNSLIHMYS